MAEAVLVMTILGIIATIMITTLKPAEFKEKGLSVLANKVIAEIDNATTQILLKHSPDGTMNNIYVQGSTQICTAESYYKNSNKTCDKNIVNLYKKYLGARRTSVYEIADNISVQYNNYLKSNGISPPELPPYYLVDLSSACESAASNFETAVENWIENGQNEENIPHSEHAEYCNCLKDNNNLDYDVLWECVGVDDIELTDYPPAAESHPYFGAFELKDGAVLVFTEHEGLDYVFMIDVDINGKEEPNTVNKDIFRLVITSEGINYEYSDCPNCS